MIDYEQSTIKNIRIIYNNFLQDKIHDINLIMFIKEDIRIYVTYTRTAVFRVAANRCNN